MLISVRAFAKRRRIWWRTHFFLARPSRSQKGISVSADASRSYSGRYIYDKMLSTYGWHIVAFQEPASRYEPELDRGMRAYNGGDLRKFAYQELRTLCPGLPKITRRPAGGGLPRGSVLYEMRIPGKFFDDCANRNQPSSRDPAPSASLSVILVPEGNITWIGFAADEKILRTELATVLKHSADTLASDSSLTFVREGEAKLGGFVSLAGLGGLERFLTMDQYVAYGRGWLEARPNRGRTRIPFRLDVTKTTLSFAAHVPRAAMDDLNRSKILIRDAE